MNEKEQYYQEEIESKLRLISEVLEELSSRYDNQLLALVVYQIKNELESIAMNLRSMLMEESDWDGIQKRNNDGRCFCNNKRDFT